ncbi:hypothetical protein NSQ77_01485 [Oceanobacillus sp. FSL K6-2867]|uniref:hypothetical protein n=1 Tax=Oceanobacillus sp. FSL K6-2867 TaxID=2954748 RepID=UPI0030DCA2E3
MKKRIVALSAITSAIMLLAGCGLKSEEEALAGAKEAAETAFYSEAPIETNYEMENKSIYIPDQLEVESKDESNLVLVDGKQTYIVFYNELEPASSEMNFEAAQTDQGLLLESFRDDLGFGYLRVLPDEGEGYELQIGIGGVKITTYTKKSRIENDAIELMKIAKTIAIEE